MSISIVELLYKRVVTFGSEYQVLVLLCKGSWNDKNENERQKHKMIMCCDLHFGVGRDGVGWGGMYKYIIQNKCWPFKSVPSELPPDSFGPFLI